jgi:Arc/MetJ-type ribon-helix-helix transcriptional regulator
MNIALTNDLQQLLRRKVETGQFPDEEAVVHEALRRYLVPEPPEGRPQPGPAAEAPERRLPGPFLEDETALAPAELPRSGREIACAAPHDARRQPTLFPGE